MRPAHRTVSIMLAGGKGTRLHELTERQCKPALPFGPGRRIVDWTLGCLARSGLSDLIVATQYCPADLDRHLRHRWSEAFPEMSIGDGRIWGRRDGYRGTADAVRLTLSDAMAQGADDVLIVAADHVMDMDLGPMMKAHRARGAGITVACTVASRAEARSFGVVQSDTEDRITAFVEKPSQPPEMSDAPGRCLVSMGIYICRRDWLEEALAAGGDDFGHDILPWAVARGAAACHRAVSSEGGPVFWNDVGTLDAYRSVGAALMLNPTRRGPPRLHAPKPSAGLIQRALEGTIIMPGATVASGADLRNVIVAPGARIPAGLRIGQCAEHDRQWFRVTSGGTTLVTPTMLERLAERSRPVNIPLPDRFGSGATV